MLSAPSVGRSVTPKMSTGKAVANQKEILFYPPNWKPNPLSPVVLLSHGSNVDGLSWTDWPNMELVKLLTEMYNLPCVAGDLDGAPALTTHAVGNDAAQANALTLAAWAAGQFGTKTGGGSIVMAGSSMGSHLTWNTHKNNTNLVRAAAHMLTTTSVQRNYDLAVANGTPYKSYIDTAYANVGGWDAVKATHDPWVYKGNLLPLNLKVFLSDTTDDVETHDDTVAEVTAMGQAVGAGATVKFYGLGGHDISKINFNDVAAWIMKNSGL